MHRQYLHVGGRTIAYFDSDPADHDARAVLLVHAFPLGAAMWEGQTRALPPGWRLLAPDLRGFGGSTIAEPDDNARIDDYASDVIDLIRELGFESAVIGGASMGGYVTMAVLRQQPSIAAAVIFSNTRATADTPEGRANRRGMLALLDREGSSGVARDMLPRLLGATTLAERPTVEPLVRRLIKQQSTAAIRGAVVRMMERPDSLDVVRQITVPTLVVAGDEDALIPVEDSRTLQASHATAELVVLPRSGHLSNLEQPELFNDAVRGFLSRL